MATVYQDKATGGQAHSSASPAAFPIRATVFRLVTWPLTTGLSPEKQKLDVSEGLERSCSAPRSRGGPAMRYKTRIVGGAVEVYLASHRHCVFL